MTFGKWKRQSPLILFYTNTPRAFRTTLIGYLFEISQKYDTVLLSEELDQETREYVDDKSKFPRILCTIPVHQHTGSVMNIYSKHKYLCNLAKRVVYEYDPDIIVASSDWHSIFEMYLMRFGKRNKAYRITIQDTFCVSTTKNVSLWADLINMYSRTGSFMPNLLRYSLILLRKFIGHCLYYWVLPMLCIQSPFMGSSSYILRVGTSGCRDSNFHIVFSRRDFDLSLADGVPVRKLVIMPHPINRDTRTVFTELDNRWNDGDKSGEGQSILVLMPAERIGISKDYSLIDEHTRTELQIDILQIMLEILDGYRILIKYHPLVSNFASLKNHLLSINENFCVVNPMEPAEKYIETADIIAEMPRPCSTTLLRAFFQCPQKPILALDLQDDYLGDCYKDIPGIEHVRDRKHFISVLKMIKEGRYSKDSVENHFSSVPYANVAELLEHLDDEQIWVQRDFNEN